MADSADAGQCQIPGKVDDLSDCTYSAVHSLNHHHVNPVVRELVRTAFFRYFKVGIYQKLQGRDLSDTSREGFIRYFEGFIIYFKGGILQ